MTERVIDVSGVRARIHIRNRMLHITTGEREASVPLDDVGIVLLSTHTVNVTGAALAELAEAGAAVVVCNDHALPAGMLMPLSAHCTQSERFGRQMELPLPNKKRAWQSIVRSKIVLQAELLKQVTGDTAGLPAMVQSVRSGDPENVEAQAARRYWSRLCGREFRRQRDAEDRNRYLNYGYTVLRAAAARSVCAAGLHPTLGLNHHNRYSAFCLADDIMEPYRPLVDRLACETADEFGDEHPMTREIKAKLAGALLERITFAGEVVQAADAIARTAASVAGIVEQTKGGLDLPSSLFVKNGTE